MEIGVKSMETFDEEIDLNSGLEDNPLSDVHKSEARRKIVEAINSLDVSKIDISKYTDPNVIRPLPKQEEFILADQTVVIYGGAAGSGKSEAVVLDQLQHINDPNYESIAFRRTTKSLTGAGGIFHKFGKVYHKLGAISNKQELSYTFPSGAKARCGHLEHGQRTAEANHAGLEYSKIYMEELQTFDKESFMFMISRLRSNADMPAQIKCTCNPAAREQVGGWIWEFLEGFYIDEYGYPIQENSGKTRYFITDDNGQLHFAEHPDFLKARFGNEVDPVSMTFISALIIDNEPLCVLQPNYLKGLKNLNRIERERLLFACWDVSPEGSTYFKREWCNFIDRKDMPKLTKAIRCWDLAASVPSETNPNPDSTASVLMGLGEDGNVYIMNAMEFQMRPSGVLENILERAEMDGKNIPIGIPLDPAAAGKIAFDHYAKPLILRGYKVKKLKTRLGKLQRFLGFSNAAENGMVYIIKGDWNDKFVKQLEFFDPEKRRTRDD